jgi:predicted TIM-barrel fold metal-dependent hydrolase
VADPPPIQDGTLRIDLHVHLAAMGAPGASVSPRFRRSAAFRYLRRALRLGGGEPQALTRLYADALVTAAEGAALLDRVVLLALDRPYSEAGVPLEADLFVSNAVAAETCRRSPRFLLGASVHPYRPDALEALDEAAALGAVLIKWLPNAQRFDPGSSRCRPFFRKLRDLRLPLLVHTGHEFTLPRSRQDLGDPRRLEAALGEGIAVIAAHAGTRGGLGREPYLGTMVDLCARHPNLFLECSAVWTPGRVGPFRSLLARPELHDRWVYGSDYPVPIFWPLLWGRGSRPALRAARACRNPLDARVQVALGLGLPEAALSRGAELCRR